MRLTSLAWLQASDQFGMVAGITGRIYLVEGDTSKVNHMPSAAAQQVPLCQPPHPRFFDEQLGLAVGAIDYVRGSGN